jgi:hypothetical protein
VVIITICIDNFRDDLAVDAGSIWEVESYKVVLIKVFEKLTANLNGIIFENLKLIL